MAGATWIDLLDPDEKALHDALPDDIHESALELLLAPAEHEDEPRPRLQGQGSYVFGILLVAVAVPVEDRVFYQEIDLVLTATTVLTVRKTPENGTPFSMERVKPAVKPTDSAGMIA